MHLLNFIPTYTASDGSCLGIDGQYNRSIWMSVDVSGQDCFIKNYLDHRYNGLNRSYFCIPEILIRLVETP